MKDRVGIAESEGAPAPEVGRPSTARRFRELLADLGPTFIKMGQVLSTRADILPAEYVEELSHLQDAASPIPVETVRREIARGLGRPWDEAFASIDEAPLASASIAQVHRGRTRAGEDVAVKVQRPEIREQIETDLDLLYYLAKLLEAAVEEVGVYTPSGIVEEFDRAIHEELDFENEAKNLRAFAEANRERPYLVIPRVYDELSSRTVLTMQFLAGTKITDVRDELFPRTELAKLIVQEAFHQLFSDGLFHADPHPGNLLVLPGRRVAMLDFGLVGRLTAGMQQTLVMLTLAVALGDPDTVARVVYRIGIPDTRTNLAAFKGDIATLLGRYLGRRLDQIDAGSLLRDLLDLAVRYRIRIPREYALLSRASVATEGIIRQLDPKLDIAASVLPYVREILFGRLAPTSLQGGLLRGALRLQEFAQDVPVQLSQILMDMEGGKLVVNVQGRQLDELADAVRRLAVVLMSGMLGAALVVGAFISVSRREWSFHGVPVLGAIAVALAAMLFGAVGTWYFVVVRLKKIRLAGWLRRPRRP